jgi:hypothetical protein
MKYDVATDSSGQYIYFNVDGSNVQTIIRMNNKALKFESWNGSGYDWKKETSMLFRDPSAWYHICIKIDTTNGTAANRIKLFVNGTYTTWGANDDTVAEDFAGKFFVDAATNIASTDGGTIYKGYLAEFVGIDGTAYDADSFGEFNSDSPTIWQPKDVSGLTFGTNGFYLDFEASDNLGNDANGGTDWAETNLAATDQAQDSPTNNWCVLNNLLPANNITLSEGNVYAATTTNSWSSESSTFAFTAGKWYFEVKIIGYNHNAIGIQNADNASAKAGGYPFDTAGAYGFKCYDGSKTSVAADSESYGNAVSNDQIVGCAIDLDNHKIYWSIDNTWQNSGDPTSGSTGTGSAFDLTTGITYVVCNPLNHQSGNAISSFNFGCPSHSNSSDAADADGYGAFEYAPPSGYYALCTKNLGAYGG